MRFRNYLLLLLLLVPNLVFAGGGGHSAHEDKILPILAFITGGAGVMVIVRRFGFPGVVGEISLGLVIAALAHYKLDFWVQMLHHPVIQFLAEFGSILLLFEIGLESSLKDLLKAGRYGTFTAIIGIIVPFLFGTYLIGDLILGSSNISLKLFIGATLCATSAGISARVFKDLGILRNPAAQIVLSAAIIDDVLGLLILAFVASLAESGSVNFDGIVDILIDVVAFFFIMLIIARKITPYLIRQLLKISSDESMVIAILITFCLFWSWLADAFGLAPIVGAFMAGLVLDEASFRKSNQPFWYNRLLDLSLATEDHTVKKVINEQIISHHHQERLINLLKPLTNVFVPIFFVYAGMQVDVIAVLNWKVVGLGTLLTIFAVVGKLASCCIVPKKVNRWIVGFGMVPRGEVGLIFALTGEKLGIFNQDVFAAILIMVIITSLITPVVLEQIVKRNK